jgi:hypothetical protein
MEVTSPKLPTPLQYKAMQHVWLVWQLQKQLLLHIRQHLVAAAAASLQLLPLRFLQQPAPPAAVMTALR